MPPYFCRVAHAIENIDGRLTGLARKRHDAIQKIAPFHEPLSPRNANTQVPTCIIIIGARRVSKISKRLLRAIKNFPRGGERKGAFAHYLFSNGTDHLESAWVQGLVFRRI